MQLDIRIPVAWMFIVMGALLTGYGLLEGIAVDLIWGAVLLVISIAVLVIARRDAAASGRGRRQPSGARGRT